jgi:dolichol kinase
VHYEKGILFVLCVTIFFALALCFLLCFIFIFYFLFFIFRPLMRFCVWKKKIAQLEHGLSCLSAARVVSNLADQGMHVARKQGKLFFFSGNVFLHALLVERLRTQREMR